MPHPPPLPQLSLQQVSAEPVLLVALAKSPGVIQPDSLFLSHPQTIPKCTSLVLLFQAIPDLMDKYRFMSSRVCYRFLLLLLLHLHLFLNPNSQSDSFQTQVTPHHSSSTRPSVAPSLHRWRISELLEASVGLHSHRVFPFKSSLAVSPKVWCVCLCQL